MNGQILKAFTACVGDDVTRRGIYNALHHAERGMVATNGTLLAIAWGQGIKDDITRDAGTMAVTGETFPDWQKITGFVSDTEELAGLLLTAPQMNALLTFARKWSPHPTAPVILDLGTSSIQCGRGQWALNVGAVGNDLSGQACLDAALTYSVLRHVKDKSLTVRIVPIGDEFPMVRLDVIDSDRSMLSVWQAGFKN